MKLAIILVLYKSRDEIGAFWASLAGQSFGDWRLIVIDNSPGDGSAEFLTSQGDARVSIDASPTNVGFARAVNAGLRRGVAEGVERLMLLNPDVVLPPDFLHELMAQWAATGAAVIAPRVMLLETPETSWYAGGVFDYAWAFKNRHETYHPDGPGSRIVDFASGCCLGVTATVLRQVGLLDESFFVYWEDTDFCLRLKQAGIPVQYVVDPFLLHHGAASSGGDRTPLSARLHFFGYALVLRKHMGLFLALKMIARVFVKELGRRGEPPWHAARVGWAMFRGFVAPLRRVPRL